jgi:hypothetical protein
MRNPREQKNAGFTLILAALVASIVLALGTAIFRLAQKEVALSSLGRDSQFAFYAADTGAECALFWDIRYRFFSTTSPDGVEPQCDAQPLCDKPSECVRSSEYPQTMAFDFEPNGYCASVSVYKEVVPGTNAVKTVVRADGFSTTCDNVPTSARALQRSVELHY